MSKIKSWIGFLLGIGLMIFADQMTKAIAVTKLKEQPAVPLIPGVFEFSYTENRGAAFSSFQGKGLALVCVTVLVLAFILYKYRAIPSGKRMLPLRIIFAMIVAGAIGNMIDRIVNQYVVDFLYFKLINFPVFNVADCYVCIAVFLFAIYAFFFYKENEIDFLFHLRNKSMNADEKKEENSTEE